MSRSIAALALVLLGCGVRVRENPPVCDRTLRVDLGFTSGEISAIASANAQWNAVGLEQVCLRVTRTDDRDPDTIYKLRVGSPRWVSSAEKLGTEAFVGLHHPELTSIGILEDLPLTDVELVALHELGHARGLRHADAPSVMAEHIGTATEITENDIVECRRVGACHIAR